MTEINEPIDSAASKPSGVSRRTVTMAAAWAVPVIAMAAPAPAFAASGGTITFGGEACKLPGNSQSTYKGYVFKMSASNTTNSSISITILSVTLDGNDLGAFSIINLNGCTIMGNPFPVTANTTLSTLALLTSNAPNSQNGSLVVTYTISNVVGTQTATQTVSGLNPIQGASCTAFTAGEKTCIGLF